VSETPNKPSRSALNSLSAPQSERTRNQMSSVIALCVQPARLWADCGTVCAAERLIQSAAFRGKGSREQSSMMGLLDCGCAGPGACRFRSKRMELVNIYAPHNNSEHVFSRGVDCASGK